MFLVGCSQSEKEEKGFQRIIKENQVQTEQKVKKEKLSEICDWDNAKIRAYEYAPSFGETLILQNQNYVFYPEDGRKIIRISKSDGRKKTIYEGDANKKTCIGYCMADNGLYIEYANDIYFLDFNGENKHKIISRKKVEKQISAISPDRWSGGIESIYFYKNDLYLCDGYIYKLDLSTKKIIKMSKEMTSLGGCFCDNTLYYVAAVGTAVYKVNIVTGKNKQILGKGESVKDTNSHTLKYYYGLTEVDGKVYYVQLQEEKNPVLYMYYDGKKDKKVHEIDISRFGASMIYSDSGKIAIDYINNVIVYDIKSSVTSIVENIENYFCLLYMADDMLFYYPLSSDDDADYDYALCLSYD